MDLLSLLRTVVIVSGVFGVAWLIFRFLTFDYDGERSSSRQEIRELKATVAKLEAQLADKQLPERVAVLEEIITSEDFDLERKLRQVKKATEKV